MFGNDIQRRLETEFEGAASSVVDELEKFIVAYQRLAGTQPGDRVIRCVIYLARGNREHLTHYIKAALDDPRNVMLWAEYDQDDRRINNFNMPFPVDL